MKLLAVEMTREEVQQHIDEFLARGGKIEQVPVGISGFEFKNYNQAHREKLAQIYMEREYAKTNHRTDG